MNGNTISTTSPLMALEEPAFAPEFLHIISDYIYETLRAYLERQGSQQNMVNLLDDLMIIMSAQQSVINGCGLVEMHVNMATVESVANASKCMAAQGQIFLGPHSVSIARSV